MSNNLETIIGEVQENEIRKEYSTFDEMLNDVPSNLQKCSCLTIWNQSYTADQTSYVIDFLNKKNIPFIYTSEGFWCFKSEEDLKDFKYKLFMDIKEKSEKYVTSLIQWLGEENVRYFKHLKGLTGQVFPVLKLNNERKGIPVHPVHLREGMQIRNYLRKTFVELSEIDGDLFDDYTVYLMEKVIK